MAKKQNEIELLLFEKRKMIDNLMEKYLPRVISKVWTDFLVGKNYGYNSKVLQETIADPLWNFLDRGGKRWRPLTFLLFLEAFGGNIKKARDFLIIPELIHNGSLIMDDIEDSSELRRGQKCLHHLFGNDVAINVGNLVYFLPLIVFKKNRNRFSPVIFQRAYEAYVQEMINIGLGQAIDIGWHRDVTLPNSEEEYYEMTRQKTGAMVRLPVKLAAIFSGLPPDKVEQIARICEKIAVAFQIQDDILDINLTGKDRVQFGKNFGNDVKEGKKTLMVIHVLKKASVRDKKTLLKILKKHSDNFYDVSNVIEILKKYGAIDYAREKTVRLAERAKEEIGVFFGKNKKAQMIQKLIDFLVNRTY